MLLLYGFHSGNPEGQEMGSPSVQNDYALVRGLTIKLALLHWALALCHPWSWIISQRQSAFNLIAAQCVRCYIPFYRWGNSGSQLLWSLEDVSSWHLNPGLLTSKRLHYIYATLAENINNSQWLKTRKDQQKKKFIYRVRGIRSQKTLSIPVWQHLVF